MPGKKLIFWMKFSSQGTYIRPNSVVEMARMPGGVASREELAQAEPQHEQDQESWFRNR